MGDLPDELWRRILEIGVTNPNPNRLTFEDLCRLSITSRRLHRLSNDHSLWSTLLSSDFPSNPNPNPNDSVKSMYKSRFEKDKARRIAAHKRAVLRIESRIGEYERRVVELRSFKGREAERVDSAIAELSSLRKVRQASVALNVWQPEVIRGRQKEIVEQCPVPIESRINALEMELKLCKQQIMVYDKAYRDEKQRLEAAKEQLLSMKYHPLQDYSVSNNRKVDSHSVKKRKLKQCTTG